MTKIIITILCILILIYLYCNIELVRKFGHYCLFRASMDLDEKVSKKVADKFSDL